MYRVFRAISEDQPGPKWAALFDDYWPAYKKWWSREGLTTRPTYLETRRALGAHMPEIVPLWEQLCDLAGGGDLSARFLGFFGPPPYLSGCSQAVWSGDEPLLVRNYDYSPDAFDAVILRTAWQGRQVMGLTDGLFGLIDGVNDAGLAVSLTFGGRREIGPGFGVPLILRYVLQVCSNVAEAIDALRRIPCHMSYNVTVLDADRQFRTVYLAPDRDSIVTRAAVATNHQEHVEWKSHARFTASVERERFLLQRLALRKEPADKFVASFLRPPLYSTAFAAGFGTLYTAVYQPRAGRLKMLWPDHVWEFSFTGFKEGARGLSLPQDRVAL